jgi:hypothetical protein
VPGSGASRTSILLLLALLPAQCAGPPDQSAAEESPQTVRTGTFRNPALTESSGAAVSPTQPGVVWTLNDSGNEPWLFATDTAGANLGAFRVRGAENRDWEDLAFGPCPTGSCLYISDTGDNAGRRPWVTLYRVAEPAVMPSGPARPAATARAEALVFRYPDGRHDVEAFYVDPSGDVYLVTKGLRSAPALYRIPARAWTDRAPAVAEAIGPVALAGGAALGRWVTGASLSPDGERVAVRTYRDIFIFPRERIGLGPRSTTVCDIAGLEAQGEGIAWLDERTLVLTSEGALGAPGTIAVVRCPAT